MVSIDQKTSEGKPIQLLSDTSVEKQVLNKDFSKTVDDCLKQIRDKQSRLILIARLLKEMTLNQVSKLYGLSIETVRRRQAAAAGSIKVPAADLF